MESFKHLRSFVSIKREQNIKEETISKYEKIINEYLIYLKKKNINDLLEANQTDMIEFMKEKIGSSKSLYTKKLIINTVKMFMKYFYDHKGFMSLYKNFEAVKVVTPEISPNIYSEQTIKTINNVINDEVNKEVSKDKRAVYSLRKAVNSDGFVLIKEDENEDNDVFCLKQDERKIKKDLSFSSKKENKNVEIEAGREKEGVGKNKARFFEIRMKIMLRLLVKGGVKMEELRNVRLCDISLSDGGRFVHVKVSRARRGERVLPFSPVGFWEQFLEYKELCQGEFVCSTFGGRLMYRREIEIGMAHFFDKHNLTYIGIQGFRHSYAKKLVEEGYSKERMRYLLGYRNTTSVMKYIEIFQVSA